MVNPVSSVPAIASVTGPAATTRTGEAGAFRSILEDSIRHVDGLQKDAEATINRYLTGEQEDPHTVALAVQRAELSLDMFLQVRNKVTQAYQEIMRMQL